MSRLSEAGSVRADAREEANLGRQYRPIGIGAVAAAVSVTGRRAAADMKEDRSDENQRISQVSKAA